MTSEGPGGDPLTDAALQSEIELVGDLVAAASESEGPLGEHELDRVLGVPSDSAAGEGSQAEAAAGTPAEAPADRAGAAAEDTVAEGAGADAGAEGDPGHGYPTENVT